MPELPEVETVRRGLERVLTGSHLAVVECRRASLRFPLPDRFAERLMGRKIERLSRRAKYLIADLSGGEALVMHLGMTGRFSVLGSRGGETLGSYVYESGADPRHDHIVFHVTGRGRVVYNDPRRFGYMLLIPKAELDCHPLFAGLGPEPLSDAFDAAYLARVSSSRKVNLKSLLMDQKVVAGLGNIYVSEALFRASLSPNRKASTLAARSGAGKTERLASAIKEVLSEAIAYGGSTLRDYRHADGQQGQFQEKFSVYGRAGEACVRKGCEGTIRRSVHTGRATYHCPVCQK